MTNQSNDFSENLIHEWLVAIVKAAGGTKDDVEFVGDRNKGVPGKNMSPPDYVFPFKNRKIAVEVTHLVPKDTHEGWITAKKSMEYQLNKLNEKIAGDDGTAPWIFQCECYPYLDNPPPRFKDIEERASKAFREGEPFSEHQLLPDDKKKGYGIKLELLHHVKRDDKPGKVKSVDDTHGEVIIMDINPLEEELKKELPDVIRNKEGKVTDEVKREYKYHLWWLVLDDRILVANKRCMTSQEVENIVQHVGNLIDRDLWDKVVLVSRWRQVWAIWENPASAKLPTDTDWQAPPARQCLGKQVYNPL